MGIYWFDIIGLRETTVVFHHVSEGEKWGARGDCCDGAVRLGGRWVGGEVIRAVDADP